MYPTIFNIVVDAVVWFVLLEVCGPQESQHGMGWLVGDQDVVFYTDGGHILVGEPHMVLGDDEDIHMNV